MLFVTQPTTWYLNSNLYRANVRVIRTGYDRFIPLVSELTKKYPHTRSFNATQAFNGKFKECLVDDCHMTDQGQSLIAALMAQEILGRPL